MEWLEGYIVRFKGTVLTISHDRYFLDQVVKPHRGDLTRARRSSTPATIRSTCEEKQARFDLQLKQYEQEQAKLKQLGFTVERMKGWGINNRTLYRRAMSIQHRMERIRKDRAPT